MSGDVRTGERSWWWWWFSLGREAGGPSYYPTHQFDCPSAFWSLHTTVSGLVFLVPMLVFLVVLPSFRKKRWPSLLVVLLCLVTGLLLTLVYWSSSWVVGEAEVWANTGPRWVRERGRVGLWAGLHHINLTFVTDTQVINKAVVWSSRADLTVAHRAALRGGWPWPLVSITAELGGEGLAWHGQLGNGLMHAGAVTSWLLVAVMYVWAVWVVLFSVAPQLATQPLLLSGVLTGLATVTYTVCVGSWLPPSLRVGGVVMDLHLGAAWWVTLAISIILIGASVVLMVYNAIRPGQLATVFEVDFGIVQPRPPWSRSGLLLAYTSPQDTYTQLYPPGYCPTFIHTPTHVFNERLNMCSIDPGSDYTGRKEGPTFSVTTDCAGDIHTPDKNILKSTPQTLQTPDVYSPGGLAHPYSSPCLGHQMTPQASDQPSSVQQDHPANKCVRGLGRPGGLVRPKFCTRMSLRSHSKLRSFRFSRKSPPFKFRSLSRLMDCEAGVEDTTVL